MFGQQALEIAMAGIELKVQPQRMPQRNSDAAEKRSW